MFDHCAGAKNVLVSLLSYIEKINAQRVIVGDLSDCLNNLSYSKLMEIIENKILDRSFTKLLWKALNSDYFKIEKISFFLPL